MIGKFYERLVDYQDIIDNNTFVNLRAKMEFVSWKKV
jgi:hypothetical protein